MNRILSTSCLLSLVTATSLARAQSPLQADEARLKGTEQRIYTVEDGAIVRRNGDRVNNRPLYCNHQPALAMGGDRPFVTFAAQPYICGAFMAAVVREGQGKWLHQFAIVRMLYRPGRIEWRLSDPTLPGLSANMETVTMAATPGFAVRLAIQGARAGDRVVWVFGGARQTTPPGTSVNLALDPNIYPAMMQRGFVPDDCLGNRAHIVGDRFELVPPRTPTALPPHVVAGRCDAASTPFITDAATWSNPATLAPNPASAPPDRPLVCGSIELKDGSPICWAIEDSAGEQPPQAVLSRLNDPAAVFAAGVARVRAVADRVTVQTPVDWLNVAVPASAISIDAAYYPPVYVHGGMAWNVPFPGWRTFYGPTAYGWHENVKAQCAYYIASQTTESNKRFPRAEPGLGYGQQAQDSRFYGKGRIQKDNGFYNFQTQFFDQAVYAWRATADAKLEKILLPALELQLEWARDCFDPDGDGLYESYINCWPTDSQWYNGGGTAEESAYAFTGHRAAADLARRAGDPARQAHHQAMAARIQKAVLDGLWVKDKGHVGSYREQLGLRRLHTDAWLYSIFLPIDAGMLSWAEAAQALHYTEWGLERQKMPFGGERCWTSNWVPSKWSVREMYVGDNCHLALAYYQAGLPEEAWELLKGTTLEAMYNEKSPGSINVPSGGTDFNDCSSMFCRMIVEGLFGYVPDYPNERVVVRPGFPRTWDRASIRTPDYSLAFERGTGVDEYVCSLRRPARMRLELPVYADRIDEVKVNGSPANWQALPALGRTMAVVTLDPTDKATVSIRFGKAIEKAFAASCRGNVGEAVRLACGTEPIVEFLDPQQALADAKLTDGVVVGKWNANPGHHLVLALVDVGKVKQWRAFKVEIADPVGDAAQAAKTVAAVPAGAAWEFVSLADRLNGDIRAIYKQQYLSPRPETCSVRIGSDGYSPWTFYYWNIKAPEIDLAHVPSMLTPAGAAYEASADADLDLADEATLEAWVQADPMPESGGRIIDKCRPGTFEGYMLDTYPGNSLRLHTPNGGCSYDAKLAGDRWTHVAGVYSSSKRFARLYIDGREVAFAAGGGAYPPLTKTPQPLRIGVDPAGGNRFIGRIQRAAVHRRALSADEVARRAAGAAPSEGVVADWTFASASAEVVQPSAGRVPLRRLGSPGGRLLTPQGVPFQWPPGEHNIAFTSQWDNWPRIITVPVNKQAEAAWFLICGSTNSMQTRIANARLVLAYADGVEDVLELVPPENFWTLCHIGGTDYDYKRDAFCLPKTPPPAVQLGNNCRAMLLNRRLRAGVILKSVTLETLSQEVVVGLMGLTLER